MKKFIIEGNLCLEWSDCGTDVFTIMEPGKNDLYLDDAVAEYFNVERISGNRHIGNVRITIEKIEQ